MGSLPAGLVATLVLGLRNDSRVKMALRGTKLTFEQELMALQLDELIRNTYMHTENARKGKNRPKSIYEELTKPDKQNEFATFETYEELKQALERSKHV